MRLKLSHSTRYRYETPPSYGLQRIRLTPHSTPAQQILSWDVAVGGALTEATYEDHYGNGVTLLNIEPDAAMLEIIVTGEVETTDTNGIFGTRRGPSPLWMYRRATPLTTPGEHVQAIVTDFAARDDSGLSRLHALSGQVAELVDYHIGMTDAATTAEEALERGEGVCQDQTHVFLAAARALGYPARYVSGYLMMNDRVTQDAGHAWAEAHVDTLGWVGFDISNGISPDDRYVRIACGLDYSEAAPISGLGYGAAGESLDVAIQVQQQ